MTNAPNSSTYEPSSSSDSGDNGNGSGNKKFKLKRNPAWSALLGTAIEPIYKIDWIDTR